LLALIWSQKNHLFFLVLQFPQQTIALAKDLGMPMGTAIDLKKAGSLERTTSSMIEQLTPEMRQSYELFQHAQAFLESYRGYMTEARARELIHQIPYEEFAYRD
jgi:hypothetical protein